MLVSEITQITAHDWNVVKFSFVVFRASDSSFAWLCCAL